MPEQPEAGHVSESTILSAARGSIMELAWMIDAETGQRIGINPDHVLILRELDTGSTSSNDQSDP
jgi:hypothetical protein